MKRLFITCLLLFTFSLVLRLHTLNQIGQTWDELEYVKQGYIFNNLLLKGDWNNSYFYTTYDHPPLVKYLYGLSAYFDYQSGSLHNPQFQYDFTHSRILSAIVFSIGVIITVVLGWFLFSPLVGIIAGFILSMLPFSLGLSQLVTAESWKICIYPLAIYCFIKLLEKYSLRKLIMTGLVTGIALQIKQSNALLFIIYLLISLVSLKQKKIDFHNKWKYIIRVLSFILLISVSVFILLWPQGILHFREVSAINKELWHVQFSSNPLLFTLAPPEVFFGSVKLVPIFYYVVYFFITIPIIILFFFFAGIRKIILNRSWAYLMLIIWFSVPFLMSFYSWRQHGLRYIIEIYPAIALIAAIGFQNIISKFIKEENRKFLYFIPVIFYLFVILWQTKPYYLDYFNELVGGVNTVSKHNIFQTGWWGQGLREAGMYVIATAPKNSSIGVAVFGEQLIPKSSELKYTIWDQKETYDYIIVSHYHVIRDGFDESQIVKKYKIIYQVKADQAVLVTVYKKQ